MMKIIRSMEKRISLFLLLIVLFTAMPTMADADKLDISSWAKTELLDAERYGIFKKSWYKDNFRKGISKEKTNSLLADTEKKIKTVNDKVNTNFKEVKVEDKTTRGGFLNALYNVVAKYEKETVSKDPIKYFNDQGVVKGNGKDLYLNRKINQEEAIIFAKRAIDSFFNKYDAGAKGVMWEAEKNGNKVYMLGSIHMADSSIYPYSENIMNKFDESDELYVEVDISDLEKVEKAVNKKMEEMQKSMHYTDGTKLENVIGKEMYAKLKKIMDKYETPEETYKNMKPWGVMNTITTMSALDDVIKDGGEKEPTAEELEELAKQMENMENPADYGIDMYLLQKAKEEKKPVKELEKIEMQFDLLFGSIFANPNAKLTEKEQVAALGEMIEGILNPKKEGTDKSKGISDEDMKAIEEAMAEQENIMKEMLESWRVGDVEKLKAILTDTKSDPQGMMSVLLGARDKEMAKKIAALLEGEGEKTYFVVVGAAHYVTDGMVIDLLKEKGYEVKSLNK